VFSGDVPDSPPPTPRPRLSSWTGLVEAGIVEAVRFDPFTGAVTVAYTREYMGLLRSVGVPSMEPDFIAALLIDDPVAVRLVIRRLSSRTAGSSLAKDGKGSWEE
jgi:hypothetical protein